MPASTTTTLTLCYYSRATGGLPSRVNLSLQQEPDTEEQHSQAGDDQSDANDDGSLDISIGHGSRLGIPQAEREYPGPTSIPCVGVLERLAWGDRAPRSDDEGVQPDENERHTVGGVQGSQTKARSEGGGLPSRSKGHDHVESVLLRSTQYELDRAVWPSGSGGRTRMEEAAKELVRCRRHPTFDPVHQGSLLLPGLVEASLGEHEEDDCGEPDDRENDRGRLHQRMAPASLRIVAFAAFPQTSSARARIRTSEPVSVGSTSTFMRTFWRP